MKLDRHADRFFTGKAWRVGTAALLIWTTIFEPISAQTPTPQPPAADQPPTAQAPAKVYALSDLEYLLGPVALYPDPLLTLMLQASAFPLQIVEADQWITDNQEAVQKGDFSEVDRRSWDSSVQALTRFPDVIAMLADHLDWTETLGIAFSSQAEDVANVIQLLRAKAEDAGNLKSTPQQVVTSRDEGGARVIYIAPADPERIYVPTYDSSAVFSGAVTNALFFGAGVLVGSAWNNRWGWNNRRWNQVWINPPVWHPPPPNWRPPLRPGARPPGIWRPDRPGSNRPDRPSLRPPGGRPGGGRPERPGTGRPERPGAGRPERPGAGRPERPGAGRPERPGRGRPERPTAGRPERPAARPERPRNARPERPAARPQRSQRRQESRPQRRPQQETRNRRANRPQQQARPQQRARPQQQARPRSEARSSRGGGGSQQRSRPQRTRSQGGGT